MDPQEANELSNEAEQPTPAPRRKRLLLLGITLLTVLLVVLGGFAIGNQIGGSAKTVGAMPPSVPGDTLITAEQSAISAEPASESLDQYAKYISAFWFPQEVTEAAAYFKLTQNLDFASIDPRRLVGRDMLSGSGSQSVKQWLANAGRLGKPIQGGGSCGV